MYFLSSKWAATELQSSGEGKVAQSRENWLLESI